MEEELEELREATLRRLSLQRTGTAGYTFEVVASVPGPKDEPLEGPMRESPASHLAVRVEKALKEKTPEGHTPLGSASSRVDYSDHADCEGAGGQTVNVWLAGERCYRIVLRVATAEG
jgi:hypothetical protein